MEIIKIKYNEKEDRKIMAVKIAEPVEDEAQKVFHVPMPIEGDEFHINGIIFKITYQRENPFRISAEPTGQVVLDVIQNIVKAQEEAPIEPVGSQDQQ